MTARLPSLATSSTAMSPAASYFFSCLIFLLPALALNTKLGVGLIEVSILFGVALYARPLVLQRQLWLGPARYVIAAFAVNLAVAVASSLATGFQWQFLDNPIKQLIAILVIGLVIQAKPKADWFWYGLFLGASSAGVVAVYQRFVLHLVRAEGVHMPIMFGDIAIAMAMMSLASIQRFNKTRWAMLPYLAFVGGLVGSLLSGSRGGWVALVLCFIPLYRYGRHALSRRALVIAAMALSLLIAAAFIPKIGVQQRFTDVAKDIQLYQTGDPVSSIGARIEMWKGALKLIGEHPLLGIGRANFNHGLGELISRNELSPSVIIYHHAHNEMLHALATQGIIGGIALLLVYGAPILFFSRQLRVEGAHQPFALAGLILTLSFVDFGLTQVMFSHHVGSAFYALTVGVLAGLCLMLRQSEEALPVLQAAT